MVAKTELEDFYNIRYLNGYRESLSGYEFARWSALDHIIRNILKLNNAKKVLDYGCGSGLHVDLWRKAFPFADIYFCDISSVALDKLYSKYPEFKFKCELVKENRAPFENNFFDVIVSIEVMEHVENLDDYLNDILRLLKPGGTFIWTTPCANRFSIEYIFSLLTNQIIKTSDGYIKWKWEEISHLRRLKSHEIKYRIQKIGFNKVGFRFRSHFFSFFCTCFFRGFLKKFGERMMLLDYCLFRKLPNGASMIGHAEKRFDVEINNSR